MSCRESSCLSLLAILIVLSLGPDGSAVTLTMDELAAQPVNGLSFQGVTFGFKVDGEDSLDATYNFDNGPGQHFFVQDPSLEGPASGFLTMDFAIATPQVKFGVALSHQGPLSPGFTVELFDDELMSLGATPVDTIVQSDAFQFTEGQFDYADEPVRRVAVSFNSVAERFALDNLTFVPEPSFSFFAMVGFLLPVIRRMTCAIRS